MSDDDEKQKKIIGKSDTRIPYQDRTEVVEETFFSDNTKEIKTYTLSNRGLAASAVNDDVDKDSTKTESEN